MFGVHISLYAINPKSVTILAIHFPMAPYRMDINTLLKICHAYSLLNANEDRKASGEMVVGIMEPIMCHGHYYGFF